MEATRKRMGMPSKMPLGITPRSKPRLKRFRTRF